MESPYDEYKKSSVWSIIEKAIDDLVDNQDLALTTQKNYVVGYIVKQLCANKKGQN